MRWIARIVVRACPKLNFQIKKNFFEKATPPKKSLFLVLSHVLPSVLANYVQIIGKISGKNAKNLDFLPSGWD